MRPKPRFALLAFVLVLASFARFASFARAQDESHPNLLPNAGLEGAAKDDKLPPQWEPLIVGATAEFAIDQTEKMEGEQSIRISAQETARSYARSAAMAVAPGEFIKASAWVKLRDDVPKDKGAVILIAEFTNSAGLGEEVEKFDTADIKTAIVNWQHISGVVRVPAGAANLRLRMGFSYSKGACWWDHLEVSAVDPLACRVVLGGSNRLIPAMKTAPLEILNRTAEKSAARVELTLGKQTSTDVKLKLSGEPIQRVDVPIDVSGRGKTKLLADLYLGEPKDEELAFSHRQQMLVPPAVVLDPPCPTHWAIEDGPPRLDGHVEVAVQDALRAGSSLTAQIVDSSGKVRASWKQPTTAPSADFHLDAPGLDEGSYKLIAQLKPAKGEPIKVEQPWSVIPRRLARVTLSEAGFPVYDGKEIFPLGIFNGGKFEEQGKSGFTVTHAYNAVRIAPGEAAQDQRAKDYLDESQKNGMKMLFIVPMRLAVAGDWEGFRHRIRLFRNHPALLAWDEEEGNARGDFHADTLEKIRAVLKQEDPNHPFMVGDARSAIDRVKDRAYFFPADEMDMGMWWWYPFPLEKRATTNALEGEEAAHAGEIVPPTFLTTAATTKPLWLGIQSYKKKKDSRYPTPTEYRAQAYLGVALGAKGLMWYGGSVHGGAFLNVKEAHWDELKALAKELHGMEAVLLSPAEPPPEIQPPQISACIKRGTDRPILIAVNRGDSEVQAALKSPMIGAGAVTVRGESRSVQVVEGTLHDTFAAYAVHIYELLPK